jgi:hypothetical protein
MVLTINHWPSLISAVSAATMVAVAGSPALAQKVGVAAAVGVEANRNLPDLSVRQVVQGDTLVCNEQIETGAKGQTQVRMVDWTARSIGPSSSQVIDRFLFDLAETSAVWGSNDFTLGMDDATGIGSGGGIFSGPNADNIGAVFLVSGTGGSQIDSFEAAGIIRAVKN